MHKITEEIGKTVQEFIEIRRFLHQNPEVGFEEVQTTELIAQKLSKWGYEVDRAISKTGVVGTLQVGDGEKKLGLRSDIDALPIEELGDREWKSKVTGKMHGCGHDGHTATLLCAAKYLAQTKNFSGTLHLIFQPAEELLYGSKTMIEGGLFAKHPCDAVFGLHNMPLLPKGEFYFRKGAMMASADTLEIQVNGVGGHGAVPEKTVDPALVACHIGVALQSIVARNISPFEQAVVTFGCIQAGNVANVIDNKAMMKLSVRALNSEVRQLILKRISDIATMQAQSFGATAEITHVNGCPVLVNEQEMTDFAIDVAQSLFGKDKVHGDAAPAMGSEDFAFLLEAVKKGTFVFLGAGDKDCFPVHHPKYDFDDDLIVIGASYWAGLTENFLQK